jgi:hypothetical protein
MSDTLTNKETSWLVELGQDIQADLSCDANGTGLPCRTDRLSAVDSMKRYLEIHNYSVIDKNKKPYRIMKSKSQREEGKKPFVVADARDQHLINKNFNKATGGK